MNNNEPLSDEEIVEISTFVTKVCIVDSEVVQRILATIAADRARIATLQSLVLESERMVEARDKKILIYFQIS